MVRTVWELKESDKCSMVPLLQIEVAQIIDEKTRRMKAY